MGSDENRIEIDDKGEKSQSRNVLSEYDISLKGVPIRIEVVKYPSDYVPTYNIEYPVIPFINSSMESEIRVRLVKKFTPSMLRFTNQEEYKKTEELFESETFKILDDLSPKMSSRDKKLLSVHLLTQMLGLSKIDLMLKDDNLEEICINHARDRVLVYHKKYGWLKTNFFIKSEKEIYEISEKIASRYGKELNVAKPILDDAILVSGDRATSTLYPISTKGNTLTIRKFRRDPWTIVDLISPEVKTLTPEVAALLWESIQYELNVLIAGGTASGKTSLLNSSLLFIPPNQRIVSIEDVRELNLPEHLHWVPLASRVSGGDKSEKVTMLRLMIAALRMRPDRVVLGEVRTAEEAQTLFEAADTGHATYSTFHANRIDGLFRRLMNPPIDVPESMLSSLHLAFVQYRQKKMGFRRTIEVAEITQPHDGQGVAGNMLYRWNSRNDSLESIGRSERVMEELQFFSGMSEKEIEEDIQNKVQILNWMVDNNVRSIDKVADVIQRYYQNEDEVLEMVKKALNEDDASVSN